MTSFNFFIPTRIRFGAGRLNEIGKIATNYGKKCLMVSSPDMEPLKTLHSRIKKILSGENIDVVHFDGVVPNPTIESVEEGLMLARKHRVDCVLGVGGGSSMDTAKLIALLFSGSGTPNWEETFSKYSNPFESYGTPVDTLPLIAVTTTSGTGSNVTQAAVVTDSKKEEKVTVFHQKNFPEVSIVDPELMLSMPIRGTAATGFDVFAHAFESYLGDKTSPLTEMMSLEAIKLVADNLPKVVLDPSNIEYRTKLAWADTLAGICLANGGADIPHPLSEIIGGICPRISHGECLALVYPDFLRYKKMSAIEKFATVIKKIDPKFADVPNHEAANEFCVGMDKFLKKINLWASLKDYNVTEEEYSKIIENPVLRFLPFAPEDELKKIMAASYNRT